MSLSISPVVPAATEHRASRPPPKPSASNASATASHEVLRKNAALNQVMAEYGAGVSAGQPAGSLNPLSQQIAGIAASLGKAVSLPHAPGEWTKPPATAADQGQATADNAGRLDTLA
jgi:hypothetical protein